MAMATQAMAAGRMRAWRSTVAPRGGERSERRERTIARGLRRKKKNNPVENSEMERKEATSTQLEEKDGQRVDADLDFFESVEVSANKAPPPSSSSTFPPMVWIGVGVAITVVWTKVINAAKPKLQQMAFQQMMKAMAKQGGAAGMPGMGSMPGMGNMSKPGGMPGMGNVPGMGGVPGMGMPGMGGMPGYGNAASPASNYQTSGQTGSAQQTAKPKTDSPSSGTGGQGAQTASPMGSSKEKAEPKSATSSAEQSSGQFTASTSTPEQKASPFVDQHAGAFTTTNQGERTSEAASENKSSTFEDAKVVSGEVVDESSYSQTGGSSGQGSGSFFTVEMLEKMLEDPNMQSMVYPYLPEGMRNPETFKWMLSNPEYRQQLQDMLNNMNNGEGMDPQMASMFQNFDMESDEVKEQFNAMGMTPDQVIQKIMQNPELAAAFQNPKVQKAIMECSQDPSAIFKYQGDAEVMTVFQKISELFPQAGGAGVGGMGMPGMGGY